MKINNSINSIEQSKLSKQNKTDAPVCKEDSKSLENCLNQKDFLGRSQVVFRGASSNPNEDIKKYYNNYPKETVTKIKCLMVSSASDDNKNYVKNLLKNSISNEDVLDFLNKSSNEQNNIVEDFQKNIKKIAGRVFKNQINNEEHENEIEKIVYSLALMEKFNPENYNNLTRSKGFKYIKTGALNALLLKDINALDNIDSNYFYNLFEKKEQDFNKTVESSPYLKNIDKKLLWKIVDLDPARQDEILETINKNSDGILMKNILTKCIDGSLKKEETTRKQNKEKGIFTAPSKLHKKDNQIINLIKYASNNPETTIYVARFNGDAYNLEELLNVLNKTKLPEEDLKNTKDLFKIAQARFGSITTKNVKSGISFMERNKDIDVLYGLLNTKQSFNISCILDNISPNNIDLVKMWLKQSSDALSIEQITTLISTKDFPESKNIKTIGKVIFAKDEVLSDINNQYEQMLSDAEIEKNKAKEELNNKNLSTNEINEELRLIENNYKSKKSKANNYMYKETMNRTGLIGMKLKAPEKYEKIKDSGFLDMVNSGKLDSSILKQLNTNSDLTKEMYEDLKSVKNGDSIVKEFDKTTSISDAYNKTKAGDVVEIGSQMYINDGKKLTKWEMSKEKFLELFPPVLRFATKQRSLGDCYFVSSLAKSMQNPVARANIYKSFKQDGDDILVTIKDYKEYGGSRRFKNGEIKLDENNLHIYGAKGLKMYEQAYAYATLRPEALDHTPILTDDTTPNTLMNRISSGHTPVAMSEIHSLKAYGFKEKLPNNFSNGTIGILKLTPDKLEALLQEYSAKDNVLLGFGTVSKKNSATESVLLKDYNLVSQHAYSIQGYNDKTKTVSIVNPHSSSVCTEIPLNILSKYISHLDIASL